MADSEFTTHPLPYPSPWMRGYCVRVVDGDTYYLRADLGFHVAMTIPVRLLGVDTPELSTAEGKTVRDKVRAMLEGKPVLLRTQKDTQSFARWVAEVQIFLPSGWVDLAGFLLAQGWATPLSV